MRAPFLAILAASAAVGCAGGYGAHPATTARAKGASPVGCESLGALLDLTGSMSSAPLPQTAPLAALVDNDEELAFARAAQESLAGRSRSALPVGADVIRLSRILEAEHARISAATDAARVTYAAADAALADAATCRGVDLREVSKQKEKSRDAELARSSACEDSVRLWAATRAVDLESQRSTAAAAAQLRELALDKERDAQRGRVAAALAAHEAALRALAPPKEATETHRELVRLRAAIVDQVKETFRSCTAQPDGSRVERAEGLDPRRATVMVRPTWSGALRAVADPRGTGFGSGFLVRWTRNDGRTETLVVTNRHVIQGAVEADVLLSTDLDARDRAASKGRRAHVIAADEHDDIAVLRIASEASIDRSKGLPFRLEAPLEQEVVVAAGFPGVGAAPSYQVTRGIVSNAHFGGGDQDTGISFLQHTAAIDAGNSGGPLLDDHGRLLGMNTAKLHGRENVSLAIPAARIYWALRRAEEPRRLGALHARASCNAAVDALASKAPSVGGVRRFGLTPFEESERRVDGTAVVRTGAAVVGELEGPLDEARVRAFELVRAALAADRGVMPFEACSDVTPVRAAAGAGFTATFRTRSGASYVATLGQEQDAVRVVSVRRAAPR